MIMDAILSMNVSRQSMEDVLNSKTDGFNNKNFSQLTGEMASIINNTDDLRGLKENKEGLKKAADAFESIFINILFKEMRKTIHEEDGVFPPSSAETFYREMLDEEISKNLSKSNSFGISDAVMKTYEKIVSKHEESKKINRIA